MRAYVNIRLNGTVCKSCCDRDGRGCCAADVLAGVLIEFWPYSHLFKRRVLGPDVFERAREHNLAALASAQTDAAGCAVAEFEIEKISSVAVIARLEGDQPAAIVLGVIRQAEWDLGMGAASVYKNWHLSKLLWSRLREACGLYLICGRVHDATGAPLGGLRVTARDVDLLSADDFLGTAVSDEQGCFRIEYRPEDFQERILCFRTDLRADLVFEVEQLVEGSMVVIYSETAEQVRKNVSAIFCVELEVDPVVELGEPRPETVKADVVVSITQALTVPESGPQGPVRADEFSIVGVYDVDWLLEPRFQRLLDNMAASPGAFKTVRFFGSLNSGTLENTVSSPPSGGIVWPNPGAPMDFSVTLRALEALTSRGLIPFIVLSFFPPAVSSYPITPPGSYDNWKRLVQGFLDALVADPRFGAAAISNWWFEVWNEPNITGFWYGVFDDYLNLYKATSEAVVASGHTIRLGGPALAYFNDGPYFMERFLRFLSAHPEVKCDFISLHRKGAFDPADEPQLNRVVDAAEEVANMMRSIDRARFRGLPIVNNEADMKVGFDIPYEPRMHEKFPAWLSGLTIAYDALSSQFRDDDYRFLAASDDANQQLIQNLFDGRRSIMARASASPRDLFKLPVYDFYEFLRLLGDRHGRFVSGGANYYPNTELFHAITVADTHIGSIFSIHPRTTETPRAWTLNYTLRDIGWPQVNVARFQIDRNRSNSYTAAGRMLSMPYPAAAAASAIRQAQELTVFAPIQQNVTLTGGVFRDSFTIDPYAVMLYWITPFIPDAPADPVWIEATVEDGNVILRWQPNREPFFYTYEVFWMNDNPHGPLLTPMPLRAAMWVDTAPPRGTRIYGVRAVSASGVASAIVNSPPVTI